MTEPKSKYPAHEYAIIKLGRIRLKSDFGNYTGWTQNVQQRGNNIIVDVSYSYPEGPLYRERESKSFLLEGVVDIDQLLASYTALHQAVIILPDDAEPEVGDIVYNGEVYYQWEKAMPKQYIKAHFFGLAKDGTKLPPYCGLSRIIQRNGKPVIYQSQLQSNSTDKQEGCDV